MTILNQTGQKLVQKWFCENLGTTLHWFSHFVLFPWLKSSVRRSGYFAPMTLSMAWGQSGQTLAPWSSNPSPSTTSNCHWGSRFSRFVDVSKRRALFQTYLENIYVFGCILGSRSVPQTIVLDRMRCGLGRVPGDVLAERGRNFLSNGRLPELSQVSHFTTHHSTW